MQIERLAFAGRTLEVARAGGLAGAAPVIVFLHEGLGSVALWRDLPEQLAATTGAPVLAYSRYGNGFSDPLSEPRAVDYMHDEALVVLPALLEALQIERPVLFGHSDGASIALIFAGAYPEATRGAILEAPHVFVEDVSVASIAAIGERYRASDELRVKMSRYHSDPDRTFFGWNDIWLAPAFRSWNIESSLNAIRAPLLVIAGTDDEYGTLAQVDAIAARCVSPVDRVVLSRCGHAPHRDRAGLVRTLASQWYAQIIGDDGASIPKTRTMPRL
jgi:pimeloyl-ACP methyl ester carboxylesterase